MNGKAYIVKDRPQPLAHYPHMRQVGNLVFCSGLSARQPDGTVPGGGANIRIQTEAVLENLKALLAAIGLTLENVVDITVFLIDMVDYGGFNEVYNRYFLAESGPTRTTVGVRSLPGSHLLIEVKAVAWNPHAA
ncbi:MAG TPA: RidA family protein [Candidatus Xenobia bacterium]|jgi:2-aminomuconate deaminase